MTLRLLVDTNVLAEPTRQRPESSVLRHLDEAQGETAMASIVWHELSYGVARLPAGRRRTALTEYLRGLPSRFPILPYDATAAAWHAAVRARLEAAGDVRPFSDGQIAAVAATNGLTLVTRNVRRFLGYHDLDTVTWWGERG